MSKQLFSDADLFAFSSANPIPYGYRITTSGEPSVENGEMVGIAMLASGEQQRIYLDDESWNGNSFIVLRYWKNEKNRFSHEAVTVENFQRVVGQVENSITEILGA